LEAENSSTQQRTLQYTAANSTRLTSPGLNLEVVEFARQQGVTVFPGAIPAKTPMDTSDHFTGFGMSWVRRAVRDEAAGKPAAARIGRPTGLMRRFEFRETPLQVRLSSGLGIRFQEFLARCGWQSGGAFAY
jgi:hypothetical protein